MAKDHLDFTRAERLLDFVQERDLQQVAAVWSARLFSAPLAVVATTSGEALVGDKPAQLVAVESLAASPRGTVLQRPDCQFLVAEVTVNHTSLATIVTGPYSVNADVTDEREALGQLASVLTTMADQGYRQTLTNKLYLASTELNHEELVRRSEDLALANARLLELDKLKSNLLSTVSHELRTPLMAILGFAELLKLDHEETPDPSDESGEYIESILDRGQHLLSLINRLIHLSVLEKDTVTLAKESIPVAQLANCITAEIRSRCESRNIVLEEELSMSNLGIYVDLKLAAEALSTLLDNAVKFTRPGGTIRICVHAMVLDTGDAPIPCLAPRAHVVQIDVQDEGYGVALNEVSRIFDPLYQSDSEDNRRFEGVGIGLALARRIAEAHGGTVTLNATSDQGSVFSLTLPQVEQETSLGARRQN